MAVARERADNQGSAQRAAAAKAATAAAEAQQKIDEEWKRRSPTRPSAAARKAGVDTSLFGGAIHIGGPMRLMALCPKHHFDNLETALGALPEVPATCWGQNSITALIPGAVAVSSPRSKRFPWASQFLGVVRKGVLVALFVTANASRDLVGEITSKYGKPTHTHPHGSAVWVP